MIRPGLLLASVLPLVSCSTAFHREWRQAVAQEPRTGVEGAWEGTWRSDANGHHGRLRCVVSPGDAAGNHTFHYHATWADTLSGSYHATHRVQPMGKGFVFEGNHRLPDWAGGLYTYQGSVKGNDFAASYRCPKDHGTYRMKRVATKPLDPAR